MNIRISPQRLTGAVSAIPSKSQAHRILICAAFADGPTKLICPSTNNDIEATVSCLNGIGANIDKTEYGYYVEPVSVIPTKATLDCNESGSTLRFMLPIVASLGIHTTFLLHGRLPSRPLSPLWEELERMGCQLSRPTENTIQCQGKLRSGSYSIDGSVSSQFITGLLFALALLPETSQLTISGKVESKPYIDMTLQALQLFGISPYNYHFDGRQSFHSPGNITIEGDWSNAAFFLSAKAIGNNVTVAGLNDESAQGDRMILNLLDQLEDHTVISGENCPDLIPILAIVAACKQGARFINIQRLRLKESDRISAVAEMLSSLGAKAEVIGDDLLVCPAHFHSCTIDSKNDHRIAMSAAIASTVCSGTVTIYNAECVNKSYPDFWIEFLRLGGQYEQCTR